MTAATDPIERVDLDTAILMSEHPPVLRDPNKRVVFDIACGPGDVHGGSLGYSRWAAMALPDAVDADAAAGLVLARDGYFDYVPTFDPADTVEWHVNFADPDLFVAYGSSLFAQDEMQCAEHPSLGALKEALVADGRSAVTVEHGQPTPVLVTGVERRCHVATDPSDTEGRPHGLYGNAFARAKVDAVAQATTRIEPPTMTNLIAIAAPYPGSGRYRVDEIERSLTTAYTGFLAAQLESERERGAKVRVAVHTGFWGCGAFGGNRVLMALLQVLAARMAGLDRLVFHTGAAGGSAPLEEALRLYSEDFEADASWSTRGVVDRLEAMAFTWGVGDGN